MYVELAWAITALCVLFTVPGLLISRFCPPKDPFSHCLMVGGLSLGVHFYLQLLLMSFGLYQTGVMRGMVTLEGLLLLGMLAKRIYHGLRVVPRPRLPLGVSASVGLLLLLLGVVVLLKFWLAAAFPFHSIDAVASYNTWAGKWYGFTTLPSPNQPDFNFTYPQLIPLSWAFIYKTAGASMPVESVAKTSMIVFALMLLVATSHLARVAQLAWPVALAVLVFCIPLVYVHMGIGYVDLAVTALAVGALALYLESGDDDLSQTLAAGGLLGCALLAKQAGLMAVLCFTLTGLLWRRRIPELPGPWKAVGIALAIAAPWYLYAGSHTFSNTEFLWTTQHGTRVGLERIAYGVDLIPLKFVQLSYPRWVDIATAIALIGFTLWRFPRSRDLAAGWALPATLLWGLLYSYDARNLFLALPVLALLIGGGLQALWQGLNQQLRSHHRAKYMVLTASLLILAWNTQALIATDKRLLEQGFSSLEEKKTNLLQYYRTWLFVKEELDKSLSAKLISDDWFIIGTTPKSYRDRMSGFVPVDGVTWLATGDIVLRPFPPLKPGDLMVFAASFYVDRDKQVFSRFMEQREKAGHYEKLFEHEFYRVYRVMPSGDKPVLGSMQQ